MAAPKGNKYYMNREKSGREKIFSSPDEFLQKSYEYFRWCDKNPWKRNEAIKSGEKVGKVIKVPVQRPYSIEGLCVYIGISRDTFGLYSKRKDFFGVITHVREIIEANQLEGAIVGVYKENIIARKLGLSEKTDLTSNGASLFTGIDIKIIRDKSELPLLEQEATKIN